MLELLSADFLVLFDMDVLVGREDANLIFGELDSESFDQGEFMLDLATFGLGLLFGLVELLGRSALLERHVVHRHLAGARG